MMELKCFRAFLNKSLILTTLLLIFSATTLVADIFDVISNDKVTEPTIVPKSLYIKYTKYPKNIYTQQRFSVDLEARILVQSYEYDYITTSYEDENNIQLLDYSIVWIEKENNLFVTQINYKVIDQDFKLPKIKLALIKDGEEIYTITLNPPVIYYNKIALDQEQFSNIIASALQINSIKTKQYNNKMLMVLFNIEAVDANLEEFYLKGIKDQGIKYFTQKEDIQRMYYYIIVPNHIGNIKFDYYNPNLASFIKVELPIILENDLVSTQTDLNPNDGNMLYYKQIASLILFIILFLFYLKTKSKIVLLFTVMIFIILIKLIMPNQEIVIKKDTKVYILPTSLSTVYKILDTKSKAEVLLKQKGFIKVLFKNQNIGWIKEDDIK